MRITAVILIVVASAGQPIGAQPVNTFLFEVSNDLSPQTPKATVTVWAQFDPAQYAFAGAKWDMHASEAEWSNAKIPFTGLPVLPGTVSPSGSSYLGIASGQLHGVAGIFANTSNPIVIWSAEFSTTDFTPRTIDLRSDTSEFLLYTNSLGSNASFLSSFVEGQGQINVVPAPGAVALPLFILLASRRSRPAAEVCD